MGTVGSGGSYGCICDVRQHGVGSRAAHSWPYMSMGQHVAMPSECCSRNTPWLGLCQLAGWQLLQAGRHLEADAHSPAQQYAAVRIHA